jgi:hypothetical protein
VAHQLKCLKEFDIDPGCRDNVLFYEYFDAETEKGLGATHQTGWTALITHFLETINFANQTGHKYV